VLVLGPTGVVLAGRYNSCTATGSSLVASPLIEGLSAVPTSRSLRISAGRVLLVPLDRDDALRVLDHLSDSDLRPGEVKVLRAALVYGRDTPSWWASAETLAKEAGWKDRTSVRNYLRSLRERGIVVALGSGPAPRTVIYEMAFPAEWYSRAPGEAPVASLADELADARAYSRPQPAPAAVPADDPWLDAARNVPVVRRAVIAVFGATAKPREVEQLRRRLHTLYVLSCRRHGAEARRGSAWHDALALVAAESILYALDASTLDQRWSRAFAQLGRVADSDEVYDRLKAAYEPLSPSAVAFAGFRSVPRDDGYDAAVSVDSRRSVAA
jgi:hypothetical protein